MPRDGSLAPRDLIEKLDVLVVACDFLAISVIMAVMNGVMAVMTIADLRRPASTNAVQLPELTVADGAIVVFALAMLTLAIANGLILVVAKGLP